MSVCVFGDLVQSYCYGNHGYILYVAAIRHVFKSFDVL